MLQILRKLQNILSENEHEPESFQDRIICTSMFNDITDCGSKNVQGEVSGLRERSGHLCKILTW